MIHNVEFEKYICMKKNLKDRFLTNKELVDSFLTVHKFNGAPHEIITEEWLDSQTGDVFFIQNINETEIFLILKTSTIFVNKDFLCVTNNPLFKTENILNGSITHTSTYIEGADGTGKTTAVNGLAGQGVITTDRCVEHISKIMNQDDRQLIVASVKSFLETNPTSKVIFLYVSDKNEHYRRIFSREIISEYDRAAFDLQEKYLYAYNKLKTFKNLYLVDTYNKTPRQVQDECKKIALESSQTHESESN